MSTDIFNTPVRSTSRSVIQAPMSAYVDYTPRRTNATSYDPHNRKQQREEFFHQLANSSDRNNDPDYMNSPEVRRHVGIVDENDSVEHK